MAISRRLAEPFPVGGNPFLEQRPSLFAHSVIFSNSSIVVLRNLPTYQESFIELEFEHDKFLPFTRRQIQNSIDSIVEITQQVKQLQQ